MNETQVLDIARDGIWTMIWIAGPVLLVGLTVGVAISIFQTVTHIQEMTLTFVPKILVVFFSLILLLPGMLRRLNEFTLRMMDTLIGLP